MDAVVVGFVGGSTGNTALTLGSSFCKILRRLRYRHLALLVALDDYRNLHRAAKAVHLAQPSASKLVRDLELLFGASLFERLPMGMQPTELGAVVLAFARGALDDLKRFAGDFDHRRAGCDGSLVVGATADLLPEVVVGAMVELKRRRPTLAVKLVGGEADLVVGYFGAARESDRDYERLGTEALLVVARKGRGRGLEGAAWIFHSLLRSAPRGMEAAVNVAECGSVAAAVGLLLKSDAVTVLPESVMRDHGGLVRLGVIAGEMEFGVLTRRGVALSEAEGEFVEVLRGKVKRKEEEKKRKITVLSR